MCDADICRKEANADADLEEHPTKLRRALMVAYVAAITLTLIMDFLVSLLVRFIHPDIPTNSRLSTDPDPNVPLALRLLAGLLYRLDRHLVYLGLRFDIYQLHSTCY